MGRRAFHGPPCSRHRPVRDVVLVAVAALVVAVLVVAALTRKEPARGPAAPYDHGGFSEKSVATEDVVAGQAGTVADGLTQRGYWCVQARSNDLAVQIACRSPERDIQVDVVAAPDGDVLYGDVDLGAAAGTGSAPDAEARLEEVLDAAFLRLWPQDRTTIHQLLEDARPHGMPFGRAAPPTDPAEQYSTHDRTTDDASWSVWSRYTGEPLALRVRTAQLADRSWPFGSSHYATSVEAATTRLVADGFSCTSSCHRDGLAVDLDAHAGQIVAARLTLRISTDDDGRTPPSLRWVREGLPFLTPDVQAAIGRHVQESGLRHRSWRGVVAGTPVEITAVPGAATTPDGRPARELAVRIGIPLLHVE